MRRLRLGSTRPERLLRQILVEERRQFAKMLPGLGCGGIAGILRMRLAFEDVEIGDHAGLTQLAMYAHGIGQEQVARAGCEDGRREASEVAVDRRKLRILQVMAVGVEFCGVAEPAV